MAARPLLAALWRSPTFAAVFLSANLESGIPRGSDLEVGARGAGRFGLAAGIFGDDVIVYERLER